MNFDDSFEKIYREKNGKIGFFANDEKFSHEEISEKLSVEKIRENFRGNFKKNALENFTRKKKESEDDYENVIMNDNNDMKSFLKRIRFTINLEND